MDSRRQERTRLIYHLRVFDARRKKLIGQLVDITPEGIALIGETAVPVGRTYSLRMDLPRNLMAEGHITFSAESKWCTRDTTEGFYSMGMRIVKMTPEALSLVQKLTQDFYDEEEEPGAEADADLGQIDLGLEDLPRGR
jgi:hypothetical protein